MAFITSYTFFQLCNKLDVEPITYDLFKRFIIDNKNIFRIFNSLDLKNFIIQAKLLDENNSDEDNKDRKIVVFNKIHDRKDDKSYVFKIGGKAKYHLFRDCENLHKGFKNFNVPADFPKDNIQELRDWFLKNDFTVENLEKGTIHLDTIIMRYNALFPFKYEDVKPLNSTYNLLETRATKRIDKLETFDQNKLTNNFERILFERYTLCNFNLLPLLSKYDFLYDKADDSEIYTKLSKIINSNPEIKSFIKMYKMKNLKNFWKTHFLLRKDAINNIFEFIKWKYNFAEKEFKPTFLEDYNIELCHACKIRKESIELKDLL